MHGLGQTRPNVQGRALFFRWETKTRRLNEEQNILKDHVRDLTDATGPLVSLLHFWESGRNPEAPQVVTAIKQSLLFLGNAITAQINHWRRKRVLEELRLYSSLKSVIDTISVEGENLFGQPFMKKMVEGPNQAQKAAHKQILSSNGEPQDNTIRTRFTTDCLAH